MYQGFFGGSADCAPFPARSSTPSIRTIAKRFFRLSAFVGVRCEDDGAN
jgi:hypothetical protein